ncbi:MAG: helix-turn-helix domain-containing protein, partial [Defluviitaleaceae bacterium]|nr:helix-turn-helix domain-containing protein [Defluviitaleaceae bacterium]
MMIDNRKIGSRIALLRREKGLTGEKFAELLGVSPQAVSKWENGKCLPETALLPAVAALLGASIDSILVPQELVILEAKYTSGNNGMITVTDAVNRAVEGNQLKFTAACPIGGQSVEGPAVFVLTVKYQTPDGAYYAFAPQGEMLVLDLDSEGLAAKDGFEIVGAYYGTGNRYKPVMDKMRHYAYFKWDEIHVNHETFPSSPGADEAEYLTLVYMNRTGIHVISCGENGILRYTDDRTGLYVKDTSSCLLPGVEVLEWETPDAKPEKLMPCTWAGALHAALRFMGETYTYEQIMGMSGACYRIAFCEVWDWSALDALVAFSYDEPLYAAVGYEPVWACRLEKEARAAERKKIVADILRGKPVVAINLRVAAEWGVITGYGDSGRTLYCRTYFDGDKLNENKDYLETENWPFLITHFGEKHEKPSSVAILTASLRALIESFEAPPQRGYFQGKQGYEKWIGGLRNGSLWDEHCPANDLNRRFDVHLSAVYQLVDARRCAAGWLTECCSFVSKDTAEMLKEMVDTYRGFADRLDKFKEGLLQKGVSGFTDPISGPPAREEQAALLEAALRDELKNALTAKKIINYIESDYRIERHDAFELCGFSSVIEGGMTPPKFMRQSHMSGKLKKMYGDCGIETFPEDAPCTPNEPKSLYYASYDFNGDGTYSYMICHDMPEKGAPEGYETLKVPALTWAVFSSPEDAGADPSVQCIRAWNRASEWLAASEYEYAGGRPKLEKGYNLGNLSFRYEVWIPIVKRQEKKKKNPHNGLLLDIIPDLIYKEDSDKNDVTGSHYDEENEDGAYIRDNYQAILGAAAKWHAAFWENNDAFNQIGLDWRFETKENLFAHISMMEKDFKKYRRNQEAGKIPEVWDGEFDGTPFHFENHITPQQLDYFTDAIERLKNEYWELAEARFHTGKNITVIHGDMHPGTAHISKSTDKAVKFDGLQAVRMGLPTEDLAMLIALHIEPDKQ